MKVFAAATALALALGAFDAQPAAAQGVPQTVSLATVNVKELATGYRASKVLGSNVVNDTGDSIGKIDDLIVSSNGSASYAVLSVGGFLGVAAHDVAVPTSSLKMTKDKITLPGGTKTALEGLPEYKYNTN